MSHTEGLATKEREAPLVISETYTHDSLAQLVVYNDAAAGYMAVLHWAVPEADGTTRSQSERFPMSDMAAEINAALDTLIAGLVEASEAAEAAEAAAAEAAAEAAEAAAEAAV